MSTAPIRDETGDLAIAFMSLQDVDDLDGAVHEAGRMLVEGGRLCLSVVHPLNSAGTFEGKEPDSRFLIDGSYLDSFRYADDVQRDGIRMQFHSEHRPLERYSRALEDAGFVIEAIREPAYHGEQAKELRWRRVPAFLHLRAVRARR
jgi:hypothetical protein